MLKFTHTSSIRLVFSLTGFEFEVHIYMVFMNRWIRTSLHGLMYVGFHLYTSILHLFRKTYSDGLFHEFGVLYLNKTYFWISCQKHRYISYMYIGFYPYTICFKVVSISCFCIYTSFGKIGFSFQSLVFEKYRFWFKAYFLYHKNGSNSL